MRYSYYWDLTAFSNYAIWFIMMVFNSLNMNIFWYNTYSPYTPSLSYLKLVINGLKFSLSYASTFCFKMEGQTLLPQSHLYI